MNKTIFITGASSGIGKSVAKEFSKNKWTVVASARRLDLLKKLSAQAKKGNNGLIIPIKIDVTNKKDVDTKLKKCIATHGIPDICMLNAGTNNPNDKKIINLKDTKNIFEINYFGTLNCIDTLLPFLEKSSKKTQLAIMSSVAGYRGLPYAASYCSSKAALINFTESIYNLCKNRNIFIRLINPGFIKTPLTDKNKFPMPFIISSEKAATILYKKLNYSTKFEINLPWLFCLFMKLLKLMPYSLYFSITSRLVKKL